LNQSLLTSTATTGTLGKNHEFPEPGGAPLEIQLNGGGPIENGSLVVKVEGNKEFRHHNYDPGTK
jgi:hypothetical protein